MHNNFNKVFTALVMTYFESSHLNAYRHLDIYFKRYEGAINWGISV